MENTVENFLPPTHPLPHTQGGVGPAPPRPIADKPIASFLGILALVVGEVDITPNVRRWTVPCPLVGSCSEVVNRGEMRVMRLCPRVGVDFLERPKQIGRAHV